MPDTLAALAADIADIRAKAPRGGKVVFVSGDFNIIHPGHQRLLNFAASCGDFLVVGLHGDGLGNTLIPEDLRLQGVSSLGIVGHAVILRVPSEVFIGHLRPAVVVKGREHAGNFNPEQPVVEAYGGKLLFGSGDIQYSSFDLLRQELNDSACLPLRKSADYLQRHGFTNADLLALLRRFSLLRVVVAGDLIVDEYIDCEPLGMSREDPTLVVAPLQSRRFVGGAGIVAAHARGLGAEVAYFGVADDSPTAQFAIDTLHRYQVDCTLVVDDTRPTTLKQRFRALNKTMLRVSHLRQHDIRAELVKQMAAKIEAALEDADLLIFSDFNYGCLPQALVDRLSAFCAARAIPIVADSQASSQIGDVSRFRGARLLTPTEHEARLATRDTQSGLVGLANALIDKAGAQHIIVTLASEGILIHSPHGRQGLITDRLPAFNMAPKDVSGAGDSLFVCASLALSVGADIWQSAYLGSLAAAYQVNRVGNTPLTASELTAVLSR